MLSKGACGTRRDLPALRAADFSGRDVEPVDAPHAQALRLHPELDGRSRLQQVALASEDHDASERRHLERDTEENPKGHGVRRGPEPSARCSARADVGSSQYWCPQWCGQRSQRASTT